jgi:hypothetical protein
MSRSFLRYGRFLTVLAGVSPLLKMTGGGSCLAPQNYITPDSKYNFKGQDCDVGFRVIVLAK